MTFKLDHSKLPFDTNKGPSQAQIFKYLNNTYQVIWRYNAYENRLTIKLNDYTNLRIVGIYKLAPKTMYPINDRYGRALFGIYVNNVDDPVNPDVWLITEAALIKAGIPYAEVY